jgi:dsRNA-specific ribonuclease
VPIYTVVRERGPEHDKVFEVEIAIRRQAQGCGTGKSKKEAEQKAARTVLQALHQRELLTHPSGDPLNSPDSRVNISPD